MKHVSLIWLPWYYSRGYCRSNTHMRWCQPQNQSFCTSGGLSLLLFHDLLNIIGHLNKCCRHNITFCNEFHDKILSKFLYKFNVPPVYITVSLYSHQKCIPNHSIAHSIAEWKICNCSNYIGLVSFQKSEFLYKFLCFVLLFSGM